MSYGARAGNRNTRMREGSAGVVVRGRREAGERGCLRSPTLGEGGASLGNTTHVNDLLVPPRGPILSWGEGDQHPGPATLTRRNEDRSDASQEVFSATRQQRRRPA